MQNRENSFTASHVLTDRYSQLGVRRQKNIHSRSEFHQADPLAAFELLPFADAAHDPTGEDADDLSHDDGLPIVVDPDFVQFVVIRGFVVRRQELARPILHFRDATGDWRPVHVDVHRRQKNRHLLPVTGRRPAMIRRAGNHDRAVGR